MKDLNFSTILRFGKEEEVDFRNKLKNNLYNNFIGQKCWMKDNYKSKILTCTIMINEMVYFFI